MSVNLVQFPLTVSEWQKSVKYMTDVIVGRNGQEVRNSMWQDPLMSFNASFAVRTYADITTLTNFFHAMRGREQVFLVKDWSDFALGSWTIFKETANGVRTQFQLFKPYTQTIGVTTSTYERTIKFPKQDSVRTRVAGVERTYGTQFSVNASTGVVTFTAAPANGSTVEFQIGEFYVPSRFDVDELPVEMLSYWVASGAIKSQVNIPEIPIREVRV